MNRLATLSANTPQSWTFKLIPKTATIKALVTLSLDPETVHSDFIRVKYHKAKQMIRTIAIRVWDSHSRNGRRIRLRSTWIARKLPLLRRIKMLGRNMPGNTVMGKARRQRRICEFTIQHSLGIIEAEWNQKPSGPAWPSSPTSGIVYTVKCGFEVKPAMYLLPSSRHILEDTTVNGSWPKNGSAFSAYDDYQDGIWILASTRCLSVVT
jgi:hypothetical protein